MVVGRKRVAVENLSARGMFVRHSGLERHRRVAFELRGRALSISGTARVAHATEDGVGLEFMSWDGPAHRAIRDLARGDVVAGR